VGTARRLEDAPVTALDPRLLGPLLDEPQAFEFFQAVRLLEQLYPERAPVGEFADPGDEVVRFSAPSGVGFPASEIRALEAPSGDDPARMMVNFLGLTGPQGVLPLDYSLHAVARERARDHTFKDFLGLFEHRFISLFYRAWVKTHPVAGAGAPVAADDSAPDARHEWLTSQLMSLVGMGTPGLQGRLPLSDESLLFYAGLLSLPTRPASALEQLIADYFEVPCVVEQFVGAWYPLTRAAQTALGDELGTLGGGAVAGDEVWDQQGRVRVRIGPLTRRRYDEFLPGGASHEALRALTRFFGNDQFDFEIQLVLARDEAPAFRLGDDVPLPLGWCTWLRTAPLDHDPDDALFTL
jgi:type VI secretion system protein ImpH